MKIIARNVVLAALIAAAGSMLVDEERCFHLRARYLLGITFNGAFANPNDNVVYTDYLKRHGSDHESFAKTL